MKERHIMNDINEIVFEVYKGVLEMDYSKNNKESIVAKIKKIVRYLFSGYIFEVSKIRNKLSESNHYENKGVNEELQDRIVVYTVSTGRYDEIKEPIYKDPGIDYFVFTEQELGPDSVWRKKYIPNNLKEKYTSLELARYIKTHPHEFFEDYTYSIFIDGNIRITCDIKPLISDMIFSEKKMAIHEHQVRDCVYQEAKAVFAAGKANYVDLCKQMKMYEREGFPKHFGLFETNIVIREHNDLMCKKIMNDWWNEMEKHTKRDQLSFTFALWKNGLRKDVIHSLGNNSRRNPYFIVDSHR